MRPIVVCTCGHLLAGGRYTEKFPCSPGCNTSSPWSRANPENELAARWSKEVDEADQG